MSLSDAKKNEITDEVFLTAYADKCKKMGGRLNGMNVCEIPVQHVNSVVGVNGCQNQLKGTLVMSRGVEVCSLDRNVIEGASLVAGPFKALLTPSYVYNIGEYTRFSAELQKELEKRGEKLTRDMPLVRGLLGSHLFQINNDIKEMLLKTTTPKSNDMLHLPFDTMFIDVAFTKDEVKKLTDIDLEMDEIHGILIQKSFTYPSIQRVKLTGHEEIKDDTSKPPIRACVNITYYGVKDRKPYFETSAANVNLWEKEPTCPVPSDDEKPKLYELDKQYRRTQKLVHLFALNVINFINNREVIIVPVKYDEHKMVTRRLAQGRLPIPRRSVITLTGSVKQYVQEYHDNPKWHYTYSHYVHGYFRKYQSEWYREELRGTTVWIPHYIRGKGSLVEKAYMLDKKQHGEPEEGVNIGDD